MVPAAIFVPLTAVGAPAVPPVTVISAIASKPVTASLKVKVAVKAAPLWFEGALMVTVGAVMSAITVTGMAARLPLLALSAATLAATLSTTLLRPPLGAMVAV